MFESFIFRARGYFITSLKCSSDAVKHDEKTWLDNMNGYIFFFFTFFFAREIIDVLMK